MIAALITSVMLLAAAIIPPFPFTTYDQVPNVVPERKVCDGSVLRLTAAYGEWLIFSTEGRDVFIHVSNGSPDYVYFVVGRSIDPIKVRQAVTFADAKRLYPDVCAFFAEKEA